MPLNQQARFRMAAGQSPRVRAWVVALPLIRGAIVATFGAILSAERFGCGTDCRTSC